MGALVNSKGPYGQEALKGLLLNNLARLHSRDEDFEKVHSMLKDSYVTHHGKSHLFFKAFEAAG